MTIRIQTEIEITTAALGDVAITFAESGVSDFWARVVEYRPRRWAPDDVDGRMQDNIEVPEDFVFYEIEYETPDAEGTSRDQITPALLAKGIGIFMRQGHFDDPYELAAMDAGEADLVVQFALFGEEVYA